MHYTKSTSADMMLLMAGKFDPVKKQNVNPHIVRLLSSKT